MSATVKPMTIARIQIIADALIALSVEKLNFSYAIARNLSRVRVVLAHYESTRQEELLKYAEKNDDGKPLTDFIHKTTQEIIVSGHVSGAKDIPDGYTETPHWSEENKNAFLEFITTAAKEDHSIDWHTIDIHKLDGYDIPVNAIADEGSGVRRLVPVLEPLLDIIFVEK